MPVFFIAKKSPILSVGNCLKQCEVGGGGGGEWGGSLGSGRRGQQCVYEHHTQ